ncbi:MAG TPA: hypothetical protein DCY20_11775 [Firmicutes bacterium]|nr:hypothetical protein [Bacillota bacterium]
MSKLMIDKFYKIDNYTLIEDNDNILSIEVVFDLNDCSDFQNYCSHAILNKQKMIIEFSDHTSYFELIGCSFMLGVISYNEQEQIESVDPTARGVLNFKK